ncbi:hypothetical protein BO70DRAFT_426326 [Aspergillus heteromorphus CBS 117.55]|uniref:FAD/NAD(P)-binding domain-containing protein n=1 Tax=Aspergillus heteromorphus CBS 117.55 TaxID=1448321 RepID=A0A317WU94_9EURO|nr:uncharacterized protein BO70DRAFT_426326 [Aspergillus heteromorphus CBS 117.55]PWY89909.1 hypothetical protein BO70DRAFT_426326 [Aspergillus heteromorphus CBS 117.55]
MSRSACPALDVRPEAQDMSSMDVDTIIVGNGPAAMLLSYILHGHLPYYSSNPPHPDPLLHAKLRDAPELLNADVHALTDHFAASRLSYSTQALPVNVLLDTLVRPSVDIEELGGITNVEWRYVPEKAVPHLVFGDAPRAGGQWTDNPVPASWDIQTLSYASMLSLPGYSFAEHYRKATGKELPAFTRPTREETADYFCTYPEAVRIDDVFRFSETLSGISRTENGFHIRSHNIRCKNVVLASGIFTQVLQPRPMLQPLASLQPTPEVPLLVIGSGFSAADIIISAPKDQKLLHIFKWDPEGRPSPLRGCHHQAYPEYAGVYRLMKRAALAAEPAKPKRGKMRRASSTPFLETRPWDDIYEGHPNTAIVAVEMQEEQALVTFRQSDGSTFTRPVRGMVYATGRRGSLEYLDSELLSEVREGDEATEISPVISARTLRGKAFEDIEVAPDVFIIGSLTGDSLIRFAYGSCVQAAGKLISARAGQERVRGGSNNNSRPQSSLGVMRGIDGHDISPPNESRVVDTDRMTPSIPQKIMSGGLWKWLWGWSGMKS